MTDLTTKAPRPVGEQSQPEEGVFGQVANSLNDANVGALKAAGSTVYDVASPIMDKLHELGQNYTPSLVDPNYKPMSKEDVAEQVTGDKDALTPTNTAQKVGGVGEAIGDWMIPETWVNKAAESMKIGKVADATKLLEQFPKFKAAADTALEVAGNVGKSAATGAIVGAAHGMTSSSE